MATKVFSMRLGVVACALLTLGACVKEQSSMSVEDIPGRATITGQLTYSKGQEFRNGKFNEIVAPVAGVTVYADIENTGFKAGAEGNTTFTAVTDKNGNYSFELPATSNGVSVTVRANDFVGTNSKVSGFTDRGDVKFEEADGVYSLAEEGFNVKPGSVWNYTARYGFRENNVPETFVAYAPFEIRVGLGVMKKSSDGTSIEYVYDDPEDDVNLLVRITYPNGEDFMYGVTASRNKGRANLDVPVYDKKCNLQMEVTALPYVMDGWAEYYRQSGNSSYTSRRHKGIVDQYDFRTSSYGVPETYYVSVTGLDGVVNALKAHLIFRSFDGPADETFDNPTLWRYAQFAE